MSDLDFPAVSANQSCQCVIKLSIATSFGCGNSTFSSGIDVAAGLNPEAAFFQNQKEGKR
jgi:hypothetical protein